MLEIEVVVDENFDEEKQLFVPGKSATVRLEHSLVSLSKWESLWEASFLEQKQMTQEQTLSYVEIMLLDETPPEVFYKLLEKHSTDIENYLKAHMTATKFPGASTGSTNREKITAELIYYWMIELGIPMECQHWHLNKLFTLIKVVNFKKTPPKKMTARERRDLNRSRLALHNTTG